MNQLLPAEVARFLQDRGVGTVGTNIFIGELPKDITQGILVVLAPSSPPHFYLDTETITLDFWTVYAHTSEGYDKLRQIFNLLQRRENWETDNWYIYFSSATGDILDNDRNAEGSKLHRLNVQFICRDKNTIS